MNLSYFPRFSFSSFFLFLTSSKSMHIIGIKAPFLAPMTSIKSQEAIHLVSMIKEQEQQLTSLRVEILAHVDWNFD